MRCEAILDYWQNELGQEGWFAGGNEIDAVIRERFLGDWQAAMKGSHDDWCMGPRRTLAYVLLTDQFPRNMFRGSGEAFASDARAREAACRAVERGWDLQIDPELRVFLYLPFEHSECLSDQERMVRLLLLRLPGAAEYLLHARAHREVIRRFGRFPYRNAALGRATTAAEQAFLEAGAYGAALRAVQAAP